MTVGKFTLFFTLYAVLSLLIHFGSAFTAYAWLVYLFTLLPYYGICSLTLLQVTFVNSVKRTRVIKCQSFLLLPVIFFQIIAMLSSPVDCAGWFQGIQCSSFAKVHISHIQYLVDNINLDLFNDMSLIFWGSLLLYMISSFTFLMTCRIEGKPIQDHLHFNSN